MQNLNKNALIELQHIKLELENSRTDHLRHFVDQYFCYKHGYIKRTGSADWGGIVWNEIVSIEAQKKHPDRKSVTKEHVVPLKRIRLELLKNTVEGRISLAKISEIIDELLIFATITKEEDATLRKHKLTSSMPQGYDQISNALYGDPFARYKVAGIKFKDLRKTT